MKVSLTWIFDHIKKPMNTISVPDLVNRFNQSVAEIESFYGWQCDPSTFMLAKVTAITPEHIQLQIVNSKKKCTLAVRSDLMIGDHVLLVKTTSDAYQWGRMHDCGSNKDTLLPALDPASVDWRQQELSDVILEIDNKSITHRPDLWSHRGIAREIAALYSMALKDSAEFFNAIKVERILSKKEKIPNNAPQLSIAKNAPCRRLAAAYITAKWQPSNLGTMLRLCRIDSRPIDALVDATNFTMFDYGQPMHAFDAEKIEGGMLTARSATIGEQLTILDGSTLELHSTDLILADEEKAVSLAGVMGGAATGVSRTTKKVCIEAGSFDPATIRHTSARYGKRTEASMRFEKNLDPEMPAWALKRYINVLAQQGIPCTVESPIIDVGPAVEPLEIQITHAFIQKRLGTTLTPECIIAILSALNFGITSTKQGNDDLYIIDIPSERVHMRIPEDIVEEIGRFIGYQNIPTQLPRMLRAPTVAENTYRTRTLKQYCASTLQMREISSYAFFDETWLLHLKWQPAETMEALNPVSGNWKRLVTSLIPALLKAVHENSESAPDLRYFEVARRWLYTSPVTEQKQLAGVIYTRTPQTDFYTLKNYVDRLCKSVGIVAEARPVKEPIAPWYDPYCVAHYVYQEQIIGTIGLLAQSWKERIVQTGFVGIFELDLAALINAKIPATRYQPLPKYPDVVRDVSTLIPTNLPAAEIMEHIKKIDKRIATVELIDFFKKPEWQHKISLSFRYTIRDATKTLTTPEADQISMAIEMELQRCGGEIR